MTHRFVRTVVPLCSSLLLACLVALPALGSVPSTVDDQVTWLGDILVSGMQELYGASAAPAAVAGRSELVEGLGQVLQRPLTTRELTEFQALLFDDGGPLTPGDLPPVEMGMRRDARLRVAWLRDYLARPPLTDEERGVLDRQLADLAETLRSGLASELSADVADKAAAEKVVAEEVTDLFSRRVAQLMSGPMTPYFKRAFSPEQMASLVGAASQVAGEARRLWEVAKPRLKDPNSPGRLAPGDLRVATGRPVAKFAADVAEVQYAAPRLLSSDEERIWTDELHAQAAATGR
jgi:hypothetical protein